MNQAKESIFILLLLLFCLQMDSFIPDVDKRIGALLISAQQRLVRPIKSADPGSVSGHPSCVPAPYLIPGCRPDRRAKAAPGLACKNALTADALERNAGFSWKKTAAVG